MNARMDKAKSRGLWKIKAYGRRRFAVVGRSQGGVLADAFFEKGEEYDGGKRNKNGGDVDRD